MAFFGGTSSDEQKKRVAVVGMVAAGSLIIGWVMIVEPGLKKIKILETEKSSLRSKEDLLRKVIDSESKISSYQKYMAPSRDMAQLIQELVDLGEKSNVQITSISPDKSGTQNSDTDVEKLSVYVEVDCSYHQLGAYISKIESMDRFTKISRLEFGKSGGADSKSAGSKRGIVVVSRFFAGGAVA